MTIRQNRTLLFTLLLLSISQLAFASDKLFSIYTPYTFATSALPYNADQKVVNNDTSGKKFGIFLFGLINQIFDRNLTVTHF